MTEYLADIPSRQEEESRIVANWLRRIQDILSEGPPNLFWRALGYAGLVGGRKRAALLPTGYDVSRTS